MLYRISKPFSTGRTNCRYSSPPQDTPHHEGATHHQNVPYRPNATGTTGTDPTQPPRPNASNGRSGRPLGGEEDGVPTKALATNNNHTRGRPETGHTTKTHARRETNDVGTATATKHGRPGPYGPPHNPRRANHRQTNTSEPTPRTGRAPVATHPPHRTGRPPQPSEQIEKTTKTTSGYTGPGCTTGYRPNCCKTTTRQ